MLGGVGGVSGHRPQRQNSVVQGHGLLRRYGLIFVQPGSRAVVSSRVGGGVNTVGSELVSETSSHSVGRW
jgi:hypothetical protein